MKTVFALIIFLFLCSCSDPNAPRSITYSKGDLWVADFRDGSFPSKALHNNKIYCSSIEISSGKPNYFYCLDLLSGRVNWRAPVASWASSLPLVNDSLIYYSSYLGDIYRFNPSGNLIWQTKLSGSFARHALNPINSNLLVLTVDDGCYEFEKSTGKVAQHWGNGSLGMKMPVIDGHKIILTEVNRDTNFVGDGSLMACLDYYTKDTLWQKETVSNVDIEQPYLNNGKLYYFSQQYLHCIDAASGLSIWSSPALKVSLSFWPHLYFEQGRLLFVGDYTKVIVLNEANGQLIESAERKELEKRSPFLPFMRSYIIEAGNNTTYTAVVSRSYFLHHYEYDYQIAVDKKHNR